MNTCDDNRVLSPGDLILQLARFSLKSVGSALTLKIFTALSVNPCWYDPILYSIGLTILNPWDMIDVLLT
jgi:hypothetical protein